MFIDIEVKMRGNERPESVITTSIVLNDPNQNLFRVENSLYLASLCAVAIGSALLMIPANNALDNNDLTGQFLFTNLVSGLLAGITGALLGFYINKYAQERCNNTSLTRAQPSPLNESELKKALLLAILSSLVSCNTSALCLWKASIKIFPSLVIGVAPVVSAATLLRFRLKIKGFCGCGPRTKHDPSEGVALTDVKTAAPAPATT